MDRFFNSGRPLQWTCRLGFLLLLLGLPQFMVAQTAPDTTRIRYSEEMMAEPIPDAKPLGRAYRKLTRLQIEEQTLWKIGLSNFGGTFLGDSLPFSSHVGLHLIHERKLRPDVSVMAELAPDFIRYRAVAGEAARNTFSVRTQVAGRYYYNLNERIRKGKSASNFSANYLSLAVGNGYGRRAQGTPFYYYYLHKPTVRTDLAVLYGLQRRLGRYGFVDFNVGLRLRLLPVFTSYDFASTLRIGLALGK